MAIYSYYRTSELEVSQASDKLEADLESENLAIQTYCLSQGWFMRQSACDENCNWGLVFDRRSAGKELMEKLKPGDIVLVSRLERIFSSCQDALCTMQELRRKNVGLHIVELGGDISSAEFKITFEKLAKSFSQLDRRKSTERIRGVKQTQRQKGRYLGGSRPFGYMIHENGRLIENPMEQRVLKKIVQLKKQGRSLRAISNEVSTPVMPISFKTVQRLLQRHSELL